MKRISSLFLALALCLGLALPASAAESEGFSDVQNHYAKAAVETWSGYGVLRGYPDGSFRPNDPVTRAEMAVVLDRVMGYQNTAENTFSDVPERAWYAQSILHLVAEGIFQGRKAGQMLPKSPITRQEAFAALARAMAVEASGEAPGFADDGAVSSWAAGYLAAMREAGYIRGDKNGAIRPDDPITRAELVTILDRMISGFVNEDGVYSRDCAGNLVVNAQDVHLEDMTIEGDLIVADGVADGDVYIERVTVKGDIVLRGCGANSFHILPGCEVKNIIVTKTTQGVIRLVNESGKTIPMIWVNDGKAGVTLDGDALGEVVIACDAPVTIAAKRVETLSVTGGAKLTVNKGSTVSSLELAETAKTAQVTVEGRVSKLTNDAGVKVDKQNGGSVGGSSGSGSSSSGGSSSGGSSSGGSSTTTPKTLSEVTLQLLAPAFGNIPDTADVLGAGCSAKTEWFNADGSAPTYRWKASSGDKDTFTADQAYKAVVTLSPVSGYTFADDLKVKVTDGNGNDFTPAKSEKNGKNWVVTLEYEATEHREFLERIVVEGPDYVYKNTTITLTAAYLDNCLTAPNYTYKWYKSEDAAGTGKTVIAGATNKTYTVPVADIKDNRTPYYTVEVLVAGKTYEAFMYKMVEVQEYASLVEGEIPIPAFGEKIRFGDTPQAEIREYYTKTISISNLISHPKLSYFCSVTANGTKDGVRCEEELESSFGALGKISAEGKIEIENTYSSICDLADVAAEDMTNAHDYVIDEIVVEVIPVMKEEGGNRNLTEKIGRKVYALDDSEKIYYHVVGMEAAVTGEAAEYRPVQDGRLVIDLGSGRAKFVNSSGNNAIPEKCNYAMLWLPDTDFPQRSGTSYDRERDGWMEYPFGVGVEWVKGVQEGKLEEQGRELYAELEFCVPGNIDHHLYIYKVRIPAERIEFAGGNG